MVSCVFEFDICLRFSVKTDKRSLNEIALQCVSLVIKIIFGKAQLVRNIREYVLITKREKIFDENNDYENNVSIGFVCSFSQSVESTSRVHIQDGGIFVFLFNLWPFGTRNQKLHIYNPTQCQGLAMTERPVVVLSPICQGIETGTHCKEYINTYACAFCACVGDCYITETVRHICGEIN